MRLLSRRIAVAYAKAALLGLVVLSAVNAAALLISGEVLVAWWIVVLIAILWPIVMTAIT